MLFLFSIKLSLSQPMGFYLFLPIPLLIPVEWGWGGVVGSSCVLIGCQLDLNQDSTERSQRVYCFASALKDISRGQ